MLLLGTREHVPPRTYCQSTSVLTEICPDLPPRVTLLGAKNLLQLLPSHWQHREKCALLKQKNLGFMFWNNSWFFPSHEFIFILIHEFFFDFFSAKNVKIRKIFTHVYSYNNQNILTWMNLLEWSSYMHISLCVVSVMAAAAADFPRLAKWLAAANLRQHTSAPRYRVISSLRVSSDLSI